MIPVNIGRAYVVYVTAILLVACATLGVPTPESFNERTAFALAQITAVRESAARLVTSGSISAEDAQNIQQQADSARAGVDIAIVIHDTDPAQAENRLKTAQVIVDALRAYLQGQVKS